MALKQAVTTSGIVRGMSAGIPQITVFRGIPFAAAPVGDLRWKAPRPAPAWEGVRDCLEFGPAAIQTAHPEGSFYQLEFYREPQQFSEDCLYLNVWTPANAADEKLPVMVWYHGGAYMHGWSHEMEFDGEALAKRGVIFVSANYRVGVLGYLAHRELRDEHGASGNYGLLDQIEALRWVQENIAAFGGDPDNVTIFGQSAGGGSVQALCASPLAKGLFRRAILMSAGSPLRTLGGSGSRSAAEANGEAFCKLAGKSIDELRTAPAEELRLLGIQYMAEARGLCFRPCLDGYALTEEPGTCFLTGSINTDSIMIGSVTGDSNTFGNDGVDPDDFGTAFTLDLGENCARIGQKAPYIYHFRRDIPGEDHPGAFHSSELWYVFSTLMRCHRPFTGVDYDISLKMTDFWANFARTGEPGGGFAPYTAESPAVMEIGDDGAAMKDMRGTPAMELCLKHMAELTGGTNA